MPCSLSETSSCDPRTLPLLVSALSVAYILLRASFLSLYSWRKSRTTASYNVINADDDDDNTDEVETPASAPPTWTLDYRTSIHLTRLLASLALLGLGINALLANKGAGKWDDQGIIIDELFVVFYLYTSLLAFLTVFPFPSSKITTWRIPQRASYYLTALHLVAWGVYAWLDIVPLAIIQPEGEKELQAAFRDQFGRLHVREMNSSASANAGVDASGNLGWREITRLSLLSFTAIVVPLILPMQYVPVDPKNPQPPSPPQTASPLSFLTYSFLDSTIYLSLKKKWANEKVEMDDVPVLADYDRSRWLVRNLFPYLDPVMREREGKRRRGMFWGILGYYRWLFATQFLLLTIQLINDFAAPVATQRLLSYLESTRNGNGGGEKKSEFLIRPWVWILWLMLGPVWSAFAQQGVYYLVTTVFVQMEATLTQLVFEHTLRVRVGSHTSTTKEVEGEGDKDKDKKSQSGTSTPKTLVDDTAGTSESREPTEASTSTIAGPSSESGDSKDPKDAKDSISVAPSEDAAGAGKSKVKLKVEDQTGKILTVLTNDLTQLQWGVYFFLPIFSVVRIAICTLFLYRILGWSALVGVGFIFLTLPAPTLIAALIVKTQAEKSKKTDARIANLTQIINVLRMVKLFAWENKVEDQIGKKRDDELYYILKGELLDMANGAMNSVIPLTTMMAVYATYTLVMKKDLTASVVFPSAAVFGLFRGVIFQCFWEIPAVLRAKVSLDRIDEYLNGGELFETVNKTTSLLSPEIAAEAVHYEAPYIRDMTFSWIKPNSGYETPGRRRDLKLVIEGELAFKVGELNLICGPTGSGKTSLLMALLGEMYSISNEPDSLCVLPRDGGIAYAAQESWVISDTIKENILFGKAYDEDRYKLVIHQTGLERDLSLLEAGDATEVGEKGITLSGGQKARITLARAVYSDAKILLLDDVLSALDVHTARWVAEKCLAGELLKGRTVLLVTHNVLLVGSMAGFVVSLGLDGKIASRGTVQDALKNNASLRAEAKKEAEAEKTADHEPADAEDGAPKPEGEAPSGKLVVEEELAIGHVSWKALKLYLTSLGGPFFYAAMIPPFLLSCVLPIMENWFLGHWADQYNYGPVSVPKYLGIYGGLLLAETLCNSGSRVIWIFGAIRASRIIHRKLLRSILTSTFRWLDTVPQSRLITRFSQDCQTIDGWFAQLLLWCVEVTITMLLNFGGTAISAGWPAVPPGIFAIIFVIICGNIYINAQLPLKRHMSNNRSPILSNLGTVLSGMVSVRAYGAQNSFREESYKRIDRYTTVARPYWNLNRWIAIRMDSLGGLFAGIVAAWLVYGGTFSAGTVGFTLTLISAFSGMLVSWIRLINEAEVQANSIERIERFLEIDHEPPPKEDGKPPAYWPSSGELRVENLSARYSVDGPVVLKDISFHVKSGDRVGVVGRTGAGKSTLSLSLLRAIPTEGKILYDGIDIHTMNLDSLRSHVTIIPQHPELLNGSLRENLDPFSEHDDAVLNDALRSAGLFELQIEGDSDAITLESEVQAGGSNFSQGQRQILALARAIVRRSRLLILDEATAAIDYETDHAIQKSIRTELHDVSVITVAHRLKTIMDSDKIMVLDAGKLAEYDSPQELLKKKSGLFWSLVEESSDREELYRLAGLNS